MTDRELVDRSQAVVIATVRDVSSHVGSDGYVVTDYRLAVEQTLKGSAKGVITVAEMGGGAEGRFTYVSDSPTYILGEKVLAFLKQRNDGTWFTTSMAMGKFSYSRTLIGESVLIRRVSELSAESVQLTDDFENFVRQAADGAPVAEIPKSHLTMFRPIEEALRPRPQSFPASAYCFGGRWEGGESGAGPLFYVTGGLTSVGASTIAIGIANGIAAWTGDPNAGVVLSGGTAPPPNNSTAPNPDDNNSVIYLGYDGPVTGTCDSALACTLISGNFQHTYKSETFISISDADIVVRSAISSSQFEGIITHEFGHAIGFRHADQGTPSDSPGVAIMHSVVPVELGSSLQSWDLEANDTVYGSGPVCTPPSIASQPSGVTITAGQSTTLSVTATGTNPRYQWYVGTASNTNTPAPNGTSNQLTVSPTATTNYWVRISGCNTFVDSRTVIVTVNQPTCTPPSVQAPTATPSSISSGQSSTLSVSPTGTAPFTYQWFVGSSGNTANPLTGQTNSSTTVSPATTTSYWVRVTGQCAPPADSPATTVTVTVGACVPPSATAPLASPSSIAPGQSSTVSVNPSGTGPFSYQWFSGGTPSQGTPIGGSTPNNFITVTPSATTQYSVRITGQCLPNFDSSSVTVTVNCTPIQAGGVSAQPATINVGQSSTVSVTTSGNGPFTFQWYRGSVGDTSNPIFGATGSSAVVSPTTSTDYWVHVTAPCGSQDGSVTVFVNAPCTPSSITTHPANATIAPGSSTTLTVVAAGTAPISYQWYTGTSGNTSNPIPNATNASVTVSPTVTTTYWVRVANSCNQTGNNSTTAVVTVSATCAAPVITTQPLSVSAPIGTAATLTVAATAPGTTIHYQWYKGAKGDLTTKVGTDSPTFTTGAVGVTTSYWVRLTPACNNLSFTDSNAAIVTATAPPRGRSVRH
jgi:hypothetical protein